MSHALELYRAPALSLLRPGPQDIARIRRLVGARRPQDANALYCSLLRFASFRETCVLAEIDGRPAGWVSAYVMPNDPETLFVWQVAVEEPARGTGLAALMLHGLLRRDACRAVNRVQTTIADSGAATWAMFGKFAARQGTRLRVQADYSQALHFSDWQDREYIVTVDLAAWMKRAA